MTTSANQTRGDDRLDVALGSRSYPIEVVSGASAETMGAFVRSALDRGWAGRSCRRALVVTDENVLPLASRVERALDSVGIASTLATVPAGEATKSLDHAADLHDALIAMRADRHTLVAAVGGGVVGDLAGFVAGTYARGVPLLMVPTSLLAQVDSSVGGKTAVNHPRAKNIIGVFHQPVAVWIDTDFLNTLPEREFRSGLAEVVKYGVILDAGFFEWLEVQRRAVIARDPATLRRVIVRSCELKAEVVRQDEREETGLRAVLNFGHTIGHAIESVSGYGGRFSHGEAVAAGMVAEARLAERLGWIGPEVTGRLQDLLRDFGLPTSWRSLDPAGLIDAMYRDKKNRGGRIRFVLPRALGTVELTDGPPESVLLEILTSVSGAA